MAINTAELPLPVYRDFANPRIWRAGNGARAVPEPWADMSRNQSVPATELLVDAPPDTFDIAPQWLPQAEEALSAPVTPQPDSMGYRVAAEAGDEFAFPELVWGDSVPSEAGDEFLFPELGWRDSIPAEETLGCKNAVAVAADTHEDLTTVAEEPVLVAEAVKAPPAVRLLEQGSVQIEKRKVTLRKSRRRHLLSGEGLGEAATIVADIAQLALAQTAVLIATTPELCQKNLQAYADIRERVIKEAAARIIQNGLDIDDGLRKLEGRQSPSQRVRINMNVRGMRRAKRNFEKASRFLEHRAALGTISEQARLIMEVR